MANMKRRTFKRSSSPGFNSYRGIYVTQCCKLKILLGGTAILLLVFFKGIIIGYWTGKKCR